MDELESQEGYHYDRFETSAPYSVLNRKERSRELAQKRRTTYKSLMKDLAEELPFSKDVVSQIDYNSRLRLALCFFRMKLLTGDKKNAQEKKVKMVESTEVVDPKNTLFTPGMLQDLMTESLDGFLLVTLGDGTVIYLSESIHKHLGLFQSEHIGFPMYDLIHEDDQHEVRRALQDAEVRAVTQLSARGSAECSFFCRIKCSRFKVSNTAAKSPGYKLVFVSGHFKVSGSEPFFVGVARPVSPPSILEIRMEGNMFVTHYTLDFKCCFFDGRLSNLLGFNKEDLIGHVPFEFHHHEDVFASLDCAKGLMTRGEGLSSYYRFQNKFGEYIWMQSRGTMMFDSRTGRPSYIVCMNFVINKEAGEKQLQSRNAITAAGNPGMGADSSRSHDPFPIPGRNNSQPNPFAEFMSMMTNMGGDVSGMAEMMGMMMGGQGMQMPPRSAETEEPSSTSLSDAGRSASTSPTSDPGTCTASVSPRNVMPDSTTCVEQSPFGNLDTTDHRIHRGCESRSDDGYHSGYGKSGSFSSTSPASIAYDSFSPASDAFLPPVHSAAVAQSQTNVKQELSSPQPSLSPSSAGLPRMSPAYEHAFQFSHSLQAVASDLPPSSTSHNHNPYCRYSSAHLDHQQIKQELPKAYPYTQYPMSMPAPGYTSSAPYTSAFPVDVNTEEIPATLPVLNVDDLQILDLVGSNRQHPPTTYPITH